ncbi:MAG TPA: hypothetical protein VLA80_09310 [Actinomycetota bacterium]|nr:hypothetical protein [Actinomycetota bacterium]
MTTHVTNGDIVVDLLRRAGLAAEAVAWANGLHEGPVPGGSRWSASASIPGSPTSAGSASWSRGGSVACWPRPPR